MLLRMYVEDKLIDEIFIMSLKDVTTAEADLLDKHDDLLETIPTDPVFYVEGVPSKLNMY